MKKLLYVLTGALLLAGVFTGCEKPEKELEKPFEPLEPELQENYTETAFGINLEMVYVKGGTFKMGATAEQEEDASEDEYPVRTIKLNGYHIGKCEVSQSQWKAVMGTTLEEQHSSARWDYGDAGEGSDYPMYYVCWTEAQEFCKRLREATGKQYVLPTEAQWEYAARGGNRSQHYKYAGSDDIDEVAWYENNSDGKTHPVGTKKANELGIYDMSGNINEWCSDGYGQYNEKNTDNPQESVSERLHTYRGGDWREYGHCRVSWRGADDWSYGGASTKIGFRIVCLP